MHTDNKNSKQLYFIAIIPEKAICEEVTKVKWDVATDYHSRAALKSPPHITLIPPFHFEPAQEPELMNTLQLFCVESHTFNISLKNFGCFAPSVIFINVQKGEELNLLFHRVNDLFENRLRIDKKRREGRAFHPHMTVAFRDLTVEMFHKAWKRYNNEQVFFSFKCDGCCLLRHNGKSWDNIFKALFAI